MIPTIGNRILSSVSDLSFITEWDIIANDTIELPIDVPPSAGFVGSIDWGVGEGYIDVEIYEGGDRSVFQKTYLTTGVYKIKVIAETNMAFNFLFYPTSKDKIINVLQWGSNSYYLVRFQYCNNLSMANTSDVLTSIGGIELSGFIADSSVGHINNIELWEITVVGMDRAFLRTNFDQNISGWNYESCVTYVHCFTGVTLSTPNYDALLISLAGQNVSPNEAFYGGNSVYTVGGAAEAARSYLISFFNWTFVSG